MTFEELFKTATIPEESGDGTFFERVEVMIRLPHKRDGVVVEYADCPISACHIWPKDDGRFELTIEVDNPLE